ncbi:hypothetical protein I6A60_24200 [Frankia sp. AgB1.9]|uniref:hypothetical protein n=1 Tax=unclassified Frankia TaxID=2632575 RepID=UPI0019337FE5|nr:MULTISPECIES: hypothetical protein [unclassified Frankia]MBL7490415.1 hypothetical protein [Frankia sp. AgW1.1]MBL7550945.1 hypothetical protein [Frankia sp. AgB1.9]MBL7625438.1 hypothetical protein [Frankia sp. AgB1.8]
MSGRAWTFRREGLVFFYRAVGPTELGNFFPTPLGITETGNIPRLELVATGAAPNVALALDHSVYDPNWHDSKGIAAGVYDLESMTVTGPGQWKGGAVNRYLSRLGAKWLTAQPGNGVWPVRLQVSAELAAAVKTAEDEHVGDFRYAWDISVAAAVEAARRVPASPDREAALGALVDALVTGGQAFLVPARPDDLAAWGPRLRQVYLALCEQSGKRDTANEHSPVEYQFSFTGGVVTVVCVAGPAHPDSSRYIKAAEVPPVFAHPSFAAYRRSAAVGGAGAGGAGGAQVPFVVGNTVKWRPAAPDMSNVDIRVYPYPESAKYVEDAINVPYLMKHVGGVVERIEASGDDYRVTVKITLLEEPADPEEPEPPEDRRMKAGQEFEQDEGYVRLWAANLVVVPS